MLSRYTVSVNTEHGVFKYEQLAKSSHDAVQTANRMLPESVSRVVSIINEDRRKKKDRALRMHLVAQHKPLPIRINHHG